MKKLTENEKAQIILNIMKEKDFNGGITTPEIEVKILNLPDFEKFWKTKTWQRTINRLMHQRLINDGEVHVGSDNDKRIFYKISRGHWTWRGNPLWLNHEKNIKETLSELKKFEEDVMEFLKKINSKTNTETRDAIIKARLNQSKFRSMLITEMKGCPITNIKEEKVLIASHIVDYKDSKNDEDKANPFNGLLLTPNIDKLFDRKMISFNHINGKVIVKKEYSVLFKKFNLGEIKLPSQFLKKYRSDFLEERNKKYHF